MQIKYVLILLFLILPNLCWSQRTSGPQSSPAPLQITDGTTSCYPYQLSITAGSITSCVNGVATVSTSGGGGGGTGTITTGSIFQIPYYSATGQTIKGATNFYNNNTNIGIGTTNGRATLDLRNADGNNLFDVYDTGDNYHALKVDGAGTVGIGTATPDATITLDVNGPTTVHGGDLVFNMVGSGNDFDVNDVFGGSGLVFTIQNPAFGNNIQIKNNVGIGDMSETPRGKLIVHNGNVGINTSDPGTVLDVQGTIRTTGVQLNLAPLAGGNVLVSNSVGVGTWMPPATIGAGGSSQWTTVNTNDVFLPNFGNVGIGTSLTTTSALTVMNGRVGIGTWKPVNTLQINGNIGIGTSITNTAKGALINVIGTEDSITGLGGTNLITFYGDTNPNANQLFSVNTSGNIGIGTVSGTSKIDIAAGNINVEAGNITLSGTVDTTSGNFIADGANSSVQIGKGGLIFNASNGSITTDSGTSTVSVMKFNEPNGTVAMTLSGSNLGIGTTSAKQKFSVVGNVGIGTVKDGDAYMINTPGNGSIAIEKNIGIGTFNPTGAFQLFGNGAAAGFVMQTNSVGIGTWVAASTLATTGGSSQWTTINTNDVYLPNNGNVGLGTTLTTTAALNIINGNVGIGTWKPTSALQIFSSGASTVSLDSNAGSKGGCIEMKDYDGSGYTYIYANNGTLFSSTSSCK